MKMRHVSFAALALVAVACAPSGSGDGADSQTGAATANAASNDSAANETIIVGAISLMKNHVHVKVKAQNPPDEFNPDFDSCETDVSYFQISGTAHDPEINALLRGQWEIPTVESCTDADSYSADAILSILDDQQGILSLTEPESDYGGGAHPNYGQEFKNIDLRTGKMLTLADYVTADAAPKLQVLINQKIATEKQRVDLEKPTFDAQGKLHHYTIQNLDADTQDEMRSFAGYYFTTYENNAERPARPDELHDFSIAGTGIRIDLVNDLPHAMQGMPASFKLLWNDINIAGVLRTDTDIVQRTKDARPRQHTVVPAAPQQ